MICLANPKPEYSEFQDLMKRTNNFLNNDAEQKRDYYKSRSAFDLEHDVKDALDEMSKNTSFEGCIELISNKVFPDIVAARYYGVEVKSTKYDHWTTTGGSIIESTRSEDVERIYITFGKLGGDKVQFISRPYESCLSDIVVTHMPRYKINMRLHENETIFDRLEISYDEFRNNDDQIGIISQYYSRNNEQLWWARNPAEEPVNMTIRKWSSLCAEEQDRLVAYGLVHFPELFSPTSRSKYERFAMYLTSKGISHHCVRDIFSAGGRFKEQINGQNLDLPALFRRVNEKYLLIKEEIQCVEYNENRRDVDEINDIDKYNKWVESVCEFVNANEKQKIRNFLMGLFAMRN